MRLTRDPVSEAVKPRPPDLAPRRAPLVTEGRPGEWAVAGAVLVVKLELDELRGAGAEGAE